jgi:hypothetical protein
MVPCFHAGVDGPQPLFPFFYRCGREDFWRSQNEFDAKVKKIRSDNDTEFKNTQVEDFLNEEDIKHEFSTPYTPY